MVTSNIDVITEWNVQVYLVCRRGKSSRFQVQKAEVLLWFCAYIGILKWHTSIVYITAIIWCVWNVLFNPLSILPLVSCRSPSRCSNQPQLLKLLVIFLAHYTFSRWPVLSERLDGCQAVVRIYRRRSVFRTDLPAHRFSLLSWHVIITKPRWLLLATLPPFKANQAIYAQSDITGSLRVPVAHGLSISEAQGSIMS